MNNKIYKLDLHVEQFLKESSPKINLQISIFGYKSTYNFK